MNLAYYLIECYMDGGLEDTGRVKKRCLRTNLTKLTPYRQRVPLRKNKLGKQWGKILAMGLSANEKTADRKKPLIESPSP